jgi:hypothetical protein
MPDAKDKYKTEVNIIRDLKKKREALIESYTHYDAVMCRDAIHMGPDEYENAMSALKEIHDIASRRGTEEEMKDAIAIVKESVDKVKKTLERYHYNFEPEALIYPIRNPMKYIQTTYLEIQRIEQLVEEKEAK